MMTKHFFLVDNYILNLFFNTVLSNTLNWALIVNTFKYGWRPTLDLNVYELQYFLNFP